MSGDTFEAEERALLEQLGRAPTDTRHAEELQRAFEALDSAGLHCLRGGSEEVSDGICRLAGERDQYKSLLLSIARPDPVRLPVLAVGRHAARADLESHLGVNERHGGLLSQKHGGPAPGCWQASPRKPSRRVEIFAGARSRL